MELQNIDAMSVDFEKSLQNSSKASSFHEEFYEREGYFPVHDTVPFFELGALSFFHDTVPFLWIVVTVLYERAPRQCRAARSAR